LGSFFFFRSICIPLLTKVNCHFKTQLQSTILTILFAIVQVIALTWYLFDFIPGGSTGFKFFGRMVGKAASSSLPI
jgi:hypothetical protein